MLSSPELVVSIRRERARELAESRLARIARLARQCCEAPGNAMARLAQALRGPQRQCCEG